MADLTSGGAATPGFYLPELNHPHDLLPPAVGAGGTISSATTGSHFWGPVLWEDGGTHNISVIGFRTGNVTAGSGSTFQVALQNLDLTDGPPAHGDGTNDQTYTSTTMPSANTWTEVTLSAVRSNVATGTLLAVVFSLPVFGASTSIALQALANPTGFKRLNTAGITTYSGAAFTGVANNPTIIFKSDDATPVIGTLSGCGPFANRNAHAFSNASNPKVHATEFVPSVDMVVTGLWAHVGAVINTDDFSIVLYGPDGSIIEAVTIDANAMTANSAVTSMTRFYGQLSTPRTLTAGTTYRVGVRPDTANNIETYSYDVAAANLLNVTPGGPDFYYNTLSSADAWGTATTTRRFMAGVHITGITTAASGGGIVPNIRWHGI